MRIALGVEYEGTRFSGWQQQLGVRTVQEVLEQAISKVANHPVKVICAGRTDSGVHAMVQVIHFDTEVYRPEHSWVFGCNANLPRDVVVLWAKPIEDTFHARFAAQARYYQYRILTRRVRSALHHKRITWCCHSLDLATMKVASQYLIGEHDFSSFRATGCQAKSPIRTIYHLELIQKEDLILMNIAANGFLQHMVRNIAGVLMTIGQGEQPPQWADQVLQARSRALGGVTAPPDGLYLVGVDYPAQFDLPKPNYPAIL
ncbi:tRNA pseudouridine(38-40) synthase TruA [Candidatus Nitrosacidococcus sp. I8]|uniref:tRNA pseudouridine(38-40) synthase TruA n=1 Tax=Candidatus Nitrosacidococcus sp. I8 TaxID=2942908 RepID=UPI0022263DB5|nr:tRNA pseudouridine(38-40) synthase TruA [Candidatus Nitrosacidococcus sp. I8]CAH9018747.1 tRNA pseudouridine synthase A [Candidatus Nitrosacidococcus sp. I8]